MHFFAWSDYFTVCDITISINDHKNFQSYITQIFMIYGYYPAMISAPGYLGYAPLKKVYIDVFRAKKSDIGKIENKNKVSKQQNAEDTPQILES